MKQLIKPIFDEAYKTLMETIEEYNDLCDTIDYKEMKVKEVVFYNKKDKD